MTAPRPRSGQPGSRRAPSTAAWFGVCVLLPLAGPACAGDDDADPGAFCEGIEQLREDDPFAQLTVASPGEMRDAFSLLARGAARVAGAAPEGAAVQARRYADAVEALRDELAGGGYDLTQIDTRRYQAGVDEYGEAATSLANTARAVCDEPGP